MNVGQKVSTRQTTLGREDAERLLKGSNRLVASKGKKVVRMDLRGSGDVEEAIQLLLGPTGNLRAPTFTVGKTVVVGFDEDAYRQVLR